MLAGHAGLGLKAPEPLSDFSDDFFKLRWRDSCVLIFLIIQPVSQSLLFG